jgi:ADP-dependent NAD(P)H-hydrate dehydratase / NAD(P)H-hydrate epimerase
MERDPNSYKGQNGKVVVIGGNELYYGAPILCALGAEASGADLVYPFIPPCQAEAAKMYSLNFIIHTFQKDHLTLKDVKPILEFSEANANVVLIGPGLGRNGDTADAIKELLSKLEKPTVVDGDALFFTNHFPKTVVLTPHRGEFHRLTGEEATNESVQKWAKSLNATILCKAPKDIIADPSHLMINETGNAMMTVGGTGDLLGGFVAGLMSQGIDPVEACYKATHLLGLGAEHLIQAQATFRAYDLARLIPTLLTENR